MTCSAKSKVNGINLVNSMVYGRYTLW
jgi:hypothetical protein